MQINSREAPGNTFEFLSNTSGADPRRNYHQSPEFQQKIANNKTENYWTQNADNAPFQPTHPLVEDHQYSIPPSNQERLKFRQAKSSVSPHHNATTSGSKKSDGLRVNTTTQSPHTIQPCSSPLRRMQNKLAQTQQNPKETQ